MGAVMGTPGWHPDPTGKPRQQYFDGTTWTQEYAPLGRTPGTSGVDRDKAVAIGVCLLIAIGLVMSFQTVSLMTGSTLVWIGVVVVVAGAAGAFILGGPTWVRVVAIIVLVIALFNAFYIEHAMAEKREEISRIFHP